MSRTHSERLPPELTDTIIDFLHDDDAALRACSLTCRAWLRSSRTHLFGSVSLTPRNASRFSRLLRRSPHLSCHVKTLDVSVDSSSDAALFSCISTGLLGCVDDFSLTWRTRKVPRAAAFARLGPLRKLKLCGRGTLDDTSILAEFLETFPTVQVLCLADQGGDDRTTKEHDLSEITAALARLCLRAVHYGGGVGDALSRCFQAAPPKKLEELSVKLEHGSEWHAVARILGATRDSLRDLDLDISSMWCMDLPSDEKMFELGEVVQSSASLGRLWLTARAEHLPFIVDLMSCIASSQLKELNLELWCYGPPYFTCLKKLARLLDDTERFPVLGSVSLELQGSSDGVDWKDFRNTVMEMFAPLAAREMLDLEFLYIEEGSE